MDGDELQVGRSCRLSYKITPSIVPRFRARRRSFVEPFVQLSPHSPFYPPKLPSPHVQASRSRLYSRYPRPTWPLPSLTAFSTRPAPRPPICPSCPISRLLSHPSDFLTSTTVRHALPTRTVTVLWALPVLTVTTLPRTNDLESVISSANITSADSARKATNASSPTPSTCAVNESARSSVALDFAPRVMSVRAFLSHFPCRFADY